MSDPTFELAKVRELGPYAFKWPDAVEEFEAGWQFELLVGGAAHTVVHRVGGREVYGRYRVHTVTWLDGEVEVEGVESDDYPTSWALLSRLRIGGRTLVRNRSEVPTEYAGFDIVSHRVEIDAPYSPRCLAVKIPEVDLLSWGKHAWFRRRSKHTDSVAAPTDPVPGGRPPPLAIPLPVDSRPEAITRALLAHGRALSESLGGGAPRFTPSADADALVRTDPFAFLVAVICDQGITAERAWAVPYHLRARLGHLDPSRIGTDTVGVRAAFAAHPKLHRFVNNVAEWVCDAARIVTSRYGGDAGRLWADRPSAAALRERLDAFPGVGQKKAAMAVEILERELGVALTGLEGSDIAYDVHVRRVFLRTGIAESDEVGHMVNAARALHPQRPGELDNPAWDVGRRWCHPSNPDCVPCPLVETCPRLISKGDIRGV
jgi:uncharacterized HhH-GPD family protein